MREILFRGKRKDNGEWVYGDLLNVGVDYDYAIRTYGGREHGQANAADEKTVGQYTGLKDKNGKKIFEGDIVRGRHWTSYNDKNDGEFHLWRVDWSEKSGLITFVDSPTTNTKMSIHDFADFEEVEIIGNIHDNPELLKGAYNA